MKISLIYTARPGKMVGNIDRNSVEAHVTGLASELTRQGHNIDVQALSQDPTQQMGSTIAGLEERWSSDKPDLVHAHMWTSGLAGLATLHQSDLLHDVPIVQTFHSLSSTRPSAGTRTQTWGRLEAAVARSVDRIVASSQSEQEELISLGADRNSITVIPHAVDIEAFSPDGPQGPRSDRTRIVAAGPLTTETGFSTALRALVRLPDVELVIAAGTPTGAGDEWSLNDDHEARRLSLIAEKLCVADRVNLITLPERDQLPLLLRSADVVVCTPWRDTPGTTAIEAMACGRPVVAAAVGELADVIIEGTTGMLVPPRNPAALASALRELLDDPIRLEGFGLAATERVHIRHSWERIGKEITGAYDELLAPA